MKLEIKHLAPYLPYKLKGVWTDLNADKRTMESKDKITILTGFQYFNKDLNIETFDKGGFGLSSFAEFKPILRPLSDLTKKIEIDNRNFIPLENLFGANYTEWDKENESSPLCVSYTYKCSKRIVEPKFLEYWIIKQILEWHFDIFNLINNGLAIDINLI